MSIPIKPSKLLRASTRFPRNRLPTARLISSTPPAPAPASAALLVDRPDHYDEDEYPHHQQHHHQYPYYQIQSSGKDAYAEEAQIDWSEWPTLPIEAFNTEGEVIVRQRNDGRDSRTRELDREMEWDNGMGSYQSSYQLELSEQASQHGSDAATLKPDLGQSTAQSSTLPLTTILKANTTTCTPLTTATTTIRGRAPLSRSESDRIFLNRLSAVTNKIEYRRDKNRSKDRVRRGEFAGEVNQGDTIQLQRHSQALSQKKDLQDQDKLDSSPVTASRTTRPSLEASTELVQRWHQSRSRSARSGSCSSASRDDEQARNRAITANDVWARLSTAQHFEGSHDERSEVVMLSGTSTIQELTNASSGVSSSMHGLYSGGPSGAPSSSSPPPATPPSDRPYPNQRPRRPTPTPSDSNPRIPTISFDPESMSLLSSISSFRRPVTKSHRPDVRTLFALKPSREPPHHASKRYKAEYTKLWDRVWVTFTAPNIIGIYNDMMDLPDPTDINNAVGLERTVQRREKWPRSSPTGGSKTGIWVRDPAHPFDPKKARWKRAVKRTVVNEILSVWGWRPLEELEAEAEREKLLAKLGKRDLVVSDAEARLLVERDAGRTLAEQFPQATFSLVDVEESRGDPSSFSRAGRRALRVRATGRDQLEVDAWLERQRQTISSETIEITGIDKLERVLPSISSLSGTYISLPHASASPPTTASIHFTDPLSRDRALRSLQQARLDLLITPAQSVSAVLLPSSSPHNPTEVDKVDKYALYPHVPTGAHAHDQWKFAGVSTYRMRRTGGWFGRASSPSPATPTSIAASGADSEAGQAVILRAGSSDATTLEDALTFPASSSQRGSTTSYTITTGHLLYTKANVNGPSLVAPLAGSRTMEEIKRWSAEKVEDRGPVFTASSPSGNGLGIGSMDVFDGTGSSGVRRRLIFSTMATASSTRGQIRVLMDGEQKEAFEVEERIVNVSRPGSDTDLQISAERSHALSTLPSGLGMLSSTHVPTSVSIGGVEYHLRSDEMLQSIEGSDGVVREKRRTSSNEGGAVSEEGEVRVMRDGGEVMRWLKTL